MKIASLLLVLSVAISLQHARAADPSTQPGEPSSRALPPQTSRYNRGAMPGRYRDAEGKMKRFELKGETAVFDGSGREFGKARAPVLLNIGAAKEMDLDAQPGKEPYVWAWRTEAGSGWIARTALADPPAPDADPQRNPKPPKDSDTPLVIDAAGGTEKLKSLRHTNTQGIIPEDNGNMGEHYTGRNPGPKDFVYVLFAVPNVQRGGVARDSISDGGKFIPALDDRDNSSPKR